ncbi:IS110 family transposase [Streptomyces sp. NRRL S-1813]|uniref:IS110 family transposase n=1 Tax=Streptomyces sp. NRRL S-1813 TaxID=1463888 RepID=UPI003B63D520
MTLGVDTHADVHVAAALEQLGRRLGSLVVPSTPSGYASLETWATGLGTVEQVGLEGTGCYGAGLSRWMRQRGHHVIEVNRPDRQTRRRRGKSDSRLAEAVLEYGGCLEVVVPAWEYCESLPRWRHPAYDALYRKATDVHETGLTVSDSFAHRAAAKPWSAWRRNCSRSGTDSRPGTTGAPPTGSPTPSAPAPLCRWSDRGRHPRMTSPEPEASLRRPARAVVRSGACCGRVVHPRPSGWQGEQPPCRRLVSLDY